MTDSDRPKSNQTGISEHVIEEVAYPAGYAAGLAPIQLAYVAALNGVVAPDPGKPFRYCELGCGSGRTVTVLAGANPDSEFVGIDLSAQHIQVGQALTKSAGLTNLEFLAEDISTLDLDALEDFDFITMHGLFAWVSDEVRAAILRFVDAKLRPGGLVHLSYNALPGWSAVAPIRQYFLERAPHVAGEPTEQVQTILDELEALREAKAPFFLANESAGTVLTAVRAQDPRYVVHEFFSPEWRPLAFREVANQMAEVGLKYVGDSRTVENLPEHSVQPAFADQVFSVEDRLEREVLKDFISNRFFRGDVYSRPAVGGPQAVSADSLLEKMRFGMERTPAESQKEIDVPGGGIRVEGSAVEVIQQLVIHETKQMVEILDHPAFSNLDRAELRSALTALTVGRGIVPCARPSIDFDVVQAAIEPVPALNRALLEEPARGWIVLSCPVTGAGIAVHAIEACMLLGLSSPDPIGTAMAELDRRSIVLSRGEESLDETERAAEVRTLLENFASNKLALLFSLGVVGEKE